MDVQGLLVSSSGNSVSDTVHPHDKRTHDMRVLLFKAVPPDLLVVATLPGCSSGSASFLPSSLPLAFLAHRPSLCPALYAYLDWGIVFGDEETEVT